MASTRPSILDAAASSFFAAPRPSDSGAGNAKDAPGPGPDCVHLASSALDQMYAARTAFTNETQNAITVITALFGGAGFLIVQALLPADGDVRIPAWRACLLLAAFGVLRWIVIVSGRFEGKLRAGYWLYSAAAVHATVVHRACGLRPSHAWLTDTEDCESQRAVFFEIGAGTGQWRCVPLEPDASFESRLEQLRLEHARSVTSGAFRALVPEPIPGKIDKMTAIEPTSLSQLLAVWRDSPVTLMEANRKTLDSTRHAARLLAQACGGLFGYCIATSGARAVSRSDPTAWLEFGCGVVAAVLFAVLARWALDRR